MEKQSNNELLVKEISIACRCLSKGYKNDLSNKFYDCDLMEVLRPKKICLVIIF